MSAVKGWAIWAVLPLAGAIEWLRSHGSASVSDEIFMLLIDSILAGMVTLIATVVLVIRTFG